MKKAVKITAITLASILGCMILLVIVYVLYVVFQFYRIEDKTATEILNNQEAVVEQMTQYTLTTYNVGFGAYNHEFDFFMDSGEFKDGTKVSGSGSKAKSLDVVLENINGSLNSLEDSNADFMFFQEVDTSATRSFYVNQYEKIREKYPAYGATFAENFHSAYLLYPFHDVHGATNAGIATLSKFQMKESVRRSFPVDLSFPNQYFDLDRCFLTTRLDVAGGKQLVLINLHMSAYDEGGKIRAQQLQMLNDVLKEEREKGNYVIAGGDFNHDLVGSEGLFETAQKQPEWISSFKSEDLTEGFEIAASVNAPTCRSTDMPYQKGKNYLVVIDGFLVSDNVEVTKVENIDLDFLYSDHNPAKLTFKLT